MDLFLKAHKVRLVSYKDKYLTAEDEESVGQSRDGSSENAIWTVECEENRNVVRLKSCFNKYLYASSLPIVPGHTAKKVLQMMPEKKTDISIEWEPIRDGFQVRMKTLVGDFLRPNGGLPPWRNLITHDVAHRPKTKDRLLWDIEVVEPRIDPVVQRPHHHRRSKSDELSSRSGSFNDISEPFPIKNSFELYR